MPIVAHELLPAVLLGNVLEGINRGAAQQVPLNALVLVALRLAKLIATPSEVLPVLAPPCSQDFGLHVDPVPERPLALLH